MWIQRLGAVLRCAAASVCSVWAHGLQVHAAEITSFHRKDAQHAFAGVPILCATVQLVCGICLQYYTDAVYGAPYKPKICATASVLELCCQDIARLFAGLPCECCVLVVCAL